MLAMLGDTVTSKINRLTRHALAAFSATLATGALAFGTADPFDTAAATPPAPRLSLTGDPAFVPCRPLAADAVYGLLEAVDQALCRNPKTREAWANARVQAAQVGVAQSDYLPGLDGKASANRQRTDGETSRSRSASITLSWLLYDFGARSANLENARQLLSAAASTLDATVQNVFLSAVQAYYNAQAARAAVSATLESEHASRESLAAAETRYRVGVATPADRLQAQTALSQAILNRIQAEGALKNALGTLANVMGLDAGSPLKLDEARRNRPDLQAAEAQVKAAQAGVDYARAAGLPTLSLAAGPAWLKTHTGGSDLASHSNAVGLTLTLPLFSGFDTTYKVRSAEARAEVAGAQRDALRLQVALDVWTAYQNLTTATQTLQSSADLLASATQSAHVALGRYKAGVGTILDLLNAQSALAAARVQRIQSGLDWRVSRAALAKSVGRLDSRLLEPAGRNLSETSTTAP